MDDRSGNGPRHAPAATTAALLALVCGALGLGGCEPDDSRDATTATDPPPDLEPIASTGADTRFDLIRTDDPSAFACLVDLGTRPGEFYDKVTDELEFPARTAFFDARFTDGTRVEIRVHPELGGPADARFEAERIAAREADGRFLTSYARAFPEREDLAETALYAWALLHRPERVPPDEAALWRARVPARIEAIARMLPASRPEPPTGDECRLPALPRRP